MKNSSKFIILASVILFFIIYNLVTVRAVILYVNKIEQDHQEKEMELVLVSFHSYYHVWPCPAGPLDLKALKELIGSIDAKINVQHMNFFQLNHVAPVLSDSSGKPFTFKPGIFSEACVVTGGKESRTSTN